MKKLRGVVAADIVASTSIPSKERAAILSAIKKLLELLKNHGVKSRLVKGDQIEMVVMDPKDTLRIALIVKAFIKSQSQVVSKTDKSNANRLQYFGRYGLRMAIAIDFMVNFSSGTGWWEGEAIYAAGRAISGDHTSEGQKIVIKSTMEFLSSNKEWQGQFDAMVKLIDVLISKATARQCEIFAHRLMNKSEDQSSRLLGISQPAVNQSLNAIGWRAINKAINHFSETIK